MDSYVEGDSGIRYSRFKVSLSFAYDQAVTIPYSTADNSALEGSDYTAKTGTVTIPRGRRTAYVLVPVVGDRVHELDENFILNLGAASNASIAEGRGVGTIQDNEPRLSINDVCLFEGNNGTRLFVFTVRLRFAYNQAVTVDYATQDDSATAGNDYLARSGSLTFARGQTTKRIAIVVYATTTPEDDEEFIVNLSNPSDNARIDVAQGYGTIRDDDSGEDD